VLVIPAAGLGTRLASPVPKVLYPVNGRPMVDYLFARYAPWVDRFVLVLHPSFLDRVRAECSTRPFAIDYAVQDQPTGMLDAILAPLPELQRQGTRGVWITWCDQIAVGRDTVTRLAELAERHQGAAAVLPTVERTTPYIHLERDPAGAIRRVLQRREGDVMPPTGESDAGLFHLSADAYFRLVPEFAADPRSGCVGAITRERNFLPFLGWLAGRAAVHTFAVTEAIESVGVNTPADLLRVERHLRGHA
jgi:bifunctional UDP-N-acetylglucosamine pyrophosphorylase/glucosamine-1-phosphate N-acetyltransferase